MDRTMIERAFTGARTFNSWQDRPVGEETLRSLYELMRWGPTSTNSNPGRFVFLTTPEAKARLIPCLAAANIAKVEAAPVTVIVAWDRRFFDKLPELFVHRPEMAAGFAANPALTQETGLRNSALQGAYMIIAARMLGLDCGPLSGFDAPAVDAAFFPQGDWSVNFLINLGYGRKETLFPRLPRLDFHAACKLV